MKKHWIVLIAVTIIVAMFSFSACEKSDPTSIGGDEGDTAIEEKTKETNEGDEPIINSQDSSSSVNDLPVIDYQVDNYYVLVEECKVYESASDSSRLKSRDELSEDAKKHAASGDVAILLKGTIVTCLELDGNWMRIPSGWICCRDEQKLYVSDTFTISDDIIKEKGSNSPGTIYDINGNLISDAYEMIPSDYSLSGKYTINGQHHENESVTFSKDGTCVMKYPEEIPNWTDEKGYWEGCNYTVKDDIVYIRNGGSQSINAYEIGGGKTLEFLYESSSTNKITFN